MEHKNILYVLRNTHLFKCRTHPPQNDILCVSFFFLYPVSVQGKNGRFFHFTDCISYIVLYSINLSSR